MKFKCLNPQIIFILFFFSTSLFAQVLQTDSLALVSLYDSTDGNNWTNKTNWLSNEPLSNWYGVTVENERVTHLILDNNNLLSVIPPNFNNLTGLLQLNLERNDLSGSFPTEVLEFVNLTVLKIRNNNFHGPIPNNIDVLINLEHLSLSNNPFSGQLPPELGNLTKLKHLAIHGTFQIDGSIPPELGNLVDLNYLILFMNDLSGSIPPELGNLVNLVSLDLYWNKLTGEIPFELGSMTNLKRLHIHKNKLTGEIPTTLGNLILLDGLSLNHNRLTGTIPTELWNLSNLEFLYLNNNQLSGSIPNEITKLAKLYRFHINANDFSSLADLSTLLSLSELFIEENNFTFRDIEPNIGISSNFTYSPQDSIGQKIDTTAEFGNSISFVVSSGGDNSIYKWIKDDVEIIGAVDSVFTIDSIDADDNGIYICEIRNTIAKELTLFSKPFILNVGNLVESEVKEPIPSAYNLYQNFPNPYNPITFISYSIPEISSVNLKVFDALGREMATLINTEQVAGNYKLEFDASNLSSGIYFYRIKAGDFVESKKMVLMK